MSRFIYRDFVSSVGFLMIMGVHNYIWNAIIPKSVNGIVSKDTVESIINVVDIPTNPTALCSPSHIPSNKPDADFTAASLA